MPTRKIRDLEPHETCTHQEHNPPLHQVYRAGVYEHTCPGCGHVQTFTVRTPIWYSPRPYFGSPSERWWETTSAPRISQRYASR